VNGLLKKRLFSSPAAFASTLERHHATLTSTERRKPDDAMTDRILKKLILKAEEDYADDAQTEAAQTDAVEEATKRSAPPTDDELQMLSQMRGAPETVRPTNVGKPKPKRLRRRPDPFVTVTAQLQESRSRRNPGAHRASCSNACRWRILVSNYPDRGKEADNPGIVLTAVGRVSPVVLLLCLDDVAHNNSTGPTTTKK
jgi:hypothetical protein